MRAFAIWVLVVGLLAGTTAMAADGNNSAGSSSTAANTPAPAEPANSGPAGNANAAASTAANAAPAASPAEEQITTELESLRSLIEAQSAQIQQQSEELKEQRDKTAALEKQLNALSSAKAGAPTSPSAVAVTGGMPVTPAASANATSSPAGGPATGAALAPAPNAPAADAAAQTNNPEVKVSFDDDFHLATEDNKFTMNIHGLFQPRFTEFVANSDAKALGASPTADSDFDIYLGRLAFSGSASTRASNISCNSREARPATRTK